MHKLADKIEANLEEIVTLESEDVGKTKEEATGDAMFSALVIRYYAGMC